ncbi:mixed lineage kinase domain-like protein [Elgaria multicarinata webbii]|uniref:mixed lineage kinase domain-like protein n=1 Tax=Elgaria multicarinata webbii TaxID=159646 RepID=UPI002FCD04D2
MDIVEGILTAAQVIYGQCQQMKHYRKHRERLVERMEILLCPIKLLQAGSPKELSSGLRGMLKKMLDLMKETQELFEKYEGWNGVEKFMKAGNMLEKFANQNERFGNIGQALLLQLQVEQKILASFEECVVCQEGSQDLAEDRVSWKEMLKGEGADPHIEITEIKKSLITKMVSVMEMKCYTLFKGEYYKSPVAVKVFKNPLTTNTKKVRKIFAEEIRTLKRLESPYILRMYGICIDETGPTPEYSIVVEYCEKGTLREVLKKEPDLSWKIRTEMASDAAAGLYRLHQTLDKCQMHRCINSTTFLIAKGYCVKLSGFKLDQTESSISRKGREKAHKEVSSSAYICPEGLASVNHQYNLASEIYSFGIVLWEIVTGKIPFAGCASEEIYEKVFKQRYREPLREDCPHYLQDIINQCRDFDPSKRPSAEGIVNQLLVDQDGSRDSLTT